MKRKKINFHGGCIRCTQQHEQPEGSNFCKGCRYYIGDWSLPDLSNRQRNEIPDYKAYFRKILTFFNWDHLMDNPHIKDSLPEMVLKQLENDRKREQKWGNELVLLANALDATCTERGEENRLVAVMLRKIEKLKKRKAQQKLSLSSESQMQVLEQIPTLKLRIKIVNTKENRRKLYDILEEKYGKDRLNEVSIRPKGNPLDDLAIIEVDVLDV